MLHSSEYFIPQEFACKCQCGFGAKEADITSDLIHALHVLRLNAKVSFVITSAARCAKHNTSVGGAPRSTHVAGVKGQCTPGYEGKCRAVDIKTTAWTPSLRQRVVAMAMALGLRVGLAADFLHLDVETAPAYAERLWIYSGGGANSGT